MSRHSPRTDSARRDSRRRAAPPRSRRGLLLAGGGIATGIAAAAALLPSINGLADASAPVPPGTDLANYPITASDNTTVYARNAALTLTTTTDHQIVSPGSPVTFTYKVQNTGGVDFRDVTVVDDKCPTITGPTGNDTDPLLNAGETWLFSCTTTVTGDETHKAKVTATPVLPGATGAPTQGGTGSPSPDPSSSASASPSSSPPPTGGLADGTYLGPKVAVNVGECPNNYCGDIQVQAVISGGKITSITVPVIPAAEATSRILAQAAVPTLVQEALDAQSSKIAVFSGASYTSRGFSTSLQAALVQAGL
jgi:uncharacterized protein with FMN-binding domain